MVVLDEQEVVHGIRSIGEQVEAGVLPLMIGCVRTGRTEIVLNQAELVAAREV